MAYATGNFTSSGLSPMLSVSRNASKELSRPLIRSFAQVVPPSANTRPNSTAGPSKSRKRSSPASPKSPTPLPTEKVPVKEDHGLYAFFRKKHDHENCVGEDKYEVVESPEAGQLLTGAFISTRRCFYLVE